MRQRPTWTRTFLNSFLRGEEVREKEVEKTVKYLMKDKYDIAVAMEKYGGSFVKAIANAWFKVDMYNRRRLEVCLGICLSIMRYLLMMNNEWRWKNGD